MVHLWHLLADASNSGNALHLPMRDDRRFPLTDVLDRAERTASDVLLALRGRPPRRLGIVMSNGEPWLRGVLTAVRLDAAAVPLPLPVGFAGADAYVEHLRRIVANSALDGVLTDASLGRAITARIGRGLDPTPLIDITEPSSARGPGTEPADGDDALAVIQYTSGSTSAPKGVMLTHRTVAAGLEAVTRGLGWTDRDAFGLWIPLFHDMGLFTLLSGLARGTSVHLWRPTDFVRRPLRWLTSFARSAATVMPAPNFCYDHLVDAARHEPPPPELDLSGWRLACNAAEPVRHRTLEAFQETFGPYGFREGTLSPGYGMAEATLIVTTVKPGDRWRSLSVDRDRLNAGNRVRTLGTGTGTGGADTAAGAGAERAVVGCGQVVPGVQLRITNDGGTPCADRIVGEVQLAGPSITGGYLDLPAAQQPFTADGWLRTGDLAFLDDGELFIVGRLKDMIAVRGQNYYAEDVEEIVRTTPGIGRTRTAAIAWSDGEDERIVVLWETALDPDTAPSFAEIARDRVKQQLGLEAVEVVPLAVATIPHTTSGKVQRQAALRLYLRTTEERAR